MQPLRILFNNEGRLLVTSEMAAMEQAAGIKIQPEFVMTADMPDKLRVGGFRVH